MKKYLEAKPDIEYKDFVSCVDELPLWSAPFGLSLLEKVEMKAGMRVLDVGCGLGFPLIELAQRLGNTCRLTGIDPWEIALERIRLKVFHYELSNVEVFNYNAESMSFDDGYFDLIVSNNGLNNVNNLEQALQECSRVAARDAQLVLAQNLENSMTEFYTVFEKVLSAKKLSAEITAMKDHIYQKRRPVNEVIVLLKKYEFNVKEVVENSFFLRFLDADAMFNHSLIRFWFADSWKKIIKTEMHDEIFNTLECELNKQAAKKGEIRLTIPYVVIDCRRR
ncbi:MAG: class I SAM-dependent methyltransferase [Bacteroidales bacterium]|nr:class I SAM-dependent methyltransferase [Bacteroidales bacterium]